MGGHYKHCWVGQTERNKVRNLLLCVPVVVLNTIIVSAKKASQEIRKKLLDANETVVLQTLYLLDSIVKNTPSSIHKDFLNSELLGALKAIVEGQGPSMAKAVDKALEMLGEWKAAFGDDPIYKIVQTTFNELEKGGYFIPEANLASASYMQKVCMSLKSTILSSTSTVYGLDMLMCETWCLIIS